MKTARFPKRLKRHLKQIREKEMRAANRRRVLAEYDYRDYSRRGSDYFHCGPC